MANEWDEFERAPAPATAAAPAASAPSPWDEFSRADEQPDPDEQIRAVFQVMQGSPDEAAQQVELEHRTGLPHDLVASQFPILKAKAEAAKFDPVRFRQESPGLADFVLQRPQAAPAVREDIAHLQGLEWFLKAPGAVLRRAAETEDYTRRSFLDASGLASDEDRQVMERYERGGEPDTGARSVLGRMWTGFLGLLPVAGRYAAVGSAGGSVGAGAGGAAGAPAAGVGAAPGAAVGAVAGAAAGALALGYYDSVGPLYRSLVNQGVEPKTAQSLAMSGGVVNGGLFAGLGKYAFRAIPGVEKALLRRAAPTVEKALAQKTVVAAFTEMGKQYGEAVAAGATLMTAQGAVNRAVEEAGRASTGDDVSLERIYKPIPEDFVHGAEAMAIMGAIAPGRALLRDLGQAAQSRQSALRLEALTEAAAKSKLLETAPTAARDLLTKMAGEEKVYSPIEDWNRFWQERNLDPAEMATKVLSDGGKGYAEASATKGELVIPAAAYLEKLARSEHGQELQAEVRLAQEGLTPRQSQAEADRITERAKALAGEAKDAKDPVEAIQEDFAGKARAAGRTQAEADAVAGLVSKAFRGWGEQLQLDPFALYRARMETYIHGPDEAGATSEPMRAAAQAVLEQSVLPEASAAKLDAKLEPLRAQIAGLDHLDPKYAAARHEMSRIVDVGLRAEGIIQDPSLLDRAKRFFTSRVSLNQNAAANVRRGFVEFRLPGVTGAPIRFDIHLLKDADRSTLAHETMHSLVEVMSGIAAEQDAPAAIRADFQTLLKAMGYASADERLTQTQERVGLGKNTARTATEEMRLRHLTAKEERVTHMWEQYLSEGKAPSADLVPVFTRFRNWMLKIYQGVHTVSAQFKERFGEELALSDDVRRVFDRLLATDEELKKVAEREPRPTEEQLSTMTPEDRAEWEKLDAEARTSAETELQQRIVEGERRENAAWFREERDRLTTEVEAQADQDHTYRAISYLKDGTLPGLETLPVDLVGEEGKPLKLDRAALEQRYGKEFVATLPRGVSLKKGGIDADYLAEKLGFTTGDDLVREIQSAKSRSAYVAAEVQKRLEDLYGPALLNDPQKLGEAALAAVTNDAAAKRVLVEMRALQKQLDPKVVARRQTIDLETVKATAKRLVESRPVGEVSAAYYASARRAAANRALKLATEGRVEAALSEKEAEILNHELYRAAVEVRAEADKITKRVKRYQDEDKRAELGKLITETKLPDGTVVQTQPYLERMDDVLGAFEFGRGTSRPEVARRERTAAWLVAEQAAGRSPYMPDRILQRLDRTTHWKDLSIAELRDLDDSVTNIAHLAKLKDTLLYKGERRSAAAIKSDLLAAIRDLPHIQVYLNEEKAPLKDRIAAKGRALEAAVRRPEELIRRMDGGTLERPREDGPWHQFYWNVIGDADYRYRQLVTEQVHPIRDAIENLPAEAKRRLRETTFTIAGQPLSLENALVVALNWGNESNATKSARGMSQLDKFGVEAWTPDTFEQVLSKLERQDWDIVQTLGKQLESKWDEVSAMHLRHTGLPPKKVSPRPFKRTLADGSEVALSGWYYPMIYDPRFPGAGKTADEAAGIGQFRLFDRGYYDVITEQGYLETRSENYARPVSLSLDALPRKMNEAMKDLAMREALLSAHEILTDTEIQAELLQRVGKEGVKMLEAHLRDTANDLVIPDGGAGIVISVANAGKHGVTGAIFAFNVAQWLQNTSGFGNAREQVPTKFLRHGLWKLLHDRGDAVQAAVDGSFGEMKTRSDHFERDIAEHLNKILVHKTKIGAASDAVSDLGLKFFASTDRYVATMTWHGAKEYAAAPKEKGGLGLSDELARRHADAVVRTSLAAARTMDLPAFMRDKRLKLVTMFAGWANGQLNRMITAGREGVDLARDGEARRGLQRFMRTWLILGLTQSASELLTGRGPKDKDDDGTDAADVGRWFAVNATVGPLMWMPYVGSEIRAMRDGRDASLTPWTRVFDTAGKAVMDTYQAADQFLTEGEVDPNLLGRAAVESAATFGYFRGLPVSQFQTTGNYLMSREGDESLGEDVLGTAFGPKREGKLSQSIYGDE